MAAAFRFWGKSGFGEGISGHITVKDPVLPGHYWMNPFGVHFSSITVRLRPHILLSTFLSRPSHRIVISISILRASRFRPSSPRFERLRNAAVPKPSTLSWLHTLLNHS